MPSQRISSVVGGIPLWICRNFPSCLVILTAVLIAPWSAQAADAPSPDAVKLRERSIAVMRQVLDQEQKWVKVHVAEAMLALGYADGVKTTFENELKLHGDEPQYRIGIWRVLARAAVQPSERKGWIDKIRTVCLDPKSPDRLHAAETWAKLGEPLVKSNGKDELTPAIEAAQSEDRSLAAFANWILINSNQPDAEVRFAEMLDSPDTDVRLCVAYGFRYLPKISEASRKKLMEAFRKEPAESKARAFLATAAAMHATPEERAAIKPELARYATTGSVEDKVETLQTLAFLGEAADLAMLSSLLDDPNADVRAMAANAILRMDRREPHFMTPWDWAIIAIYGLGMLSVGWYYSRRTKTQEEYLLGDRQMRPLMVGISLFASLISTISYLAEPGELIKNGPMLMVSTAIAYPFIGLVVGWLMIPFIMGLKVTSAYEILEVRLGSGVRTLGSLLFLSLRLMWMSVIVYATTSKVLVPLLGLDPRLTPLVCAILAFVTIIYTAMGGLRAVVITDVIQSGILFGAAIITIVTISYYLGGVSGWWPHEWLPHWPKPTYFYGPDSRLTMFGVILATSTWHICTSASDQICVQRYLSTRDAKAARTVLFISLGANLMVSFLLGAVGLGLLAFYHAFPHLLPDSQTILTDSDKLFPRYIIVGLPVGLSGLVVAGLLACAMSALSAGINSTCSVITVDIVDRLRSKKTTSENGSKGDSGRVQELKLVSIVVGLIVVFLSCFVSMVQGNLIDICYKVVNLLTAPLAGLFFLAMFIPWARGFGALVGAAFGIATVVVLSYWKEITGGQDMFIWAMPVSLLVEVGVGALASLIPIGPKPLPLNHLRSTD